MISWSVWGCPKVEARMPRSRLEPLTARRSTLPRVPGWTQRVFEPNARTFALSSTMAPASPPRSSPSEAVSMIETDEPNPESTIQYWTFG